MKVSGWSRYGQLGLGDSDDRGDEDGEMGEGLAAGTVRRSAGVS